MNPSTCPHCGRGLGNYLYADACPHCLAELAHNRKPLVAAEKQSDWLNPRLRHWIARLRHQLER